MQPPLKNQFQRARTIIQSLIQGIDPENGAELPKDSIVNKIEVNRAPTMGVFALDQPKASTPSVTKRGSPSASGSSRDTAGRHNQY